MCGDEQNNKPIQDQERLHVDPAGRSWDLITGIVASSWFHFLVFAGAQYFDNTSQKEKEDDVVQPNTEHVYTWEVTSQVSPQPDDPTCLTYTYISHENVVEDYNSGLVGALLVCKAGERDGRVCPYEAKAPLSAAPACVRRKPRCIGEADRRPPRIRLPLRGF